MRFLCPTCKEALEVPDDLAGQPHDCQYCGQRVRVPAGGRDEHIREYPGARSGRDYDDDYDDYPQRGPRGRGYSRDFEDDYDDYDDRPRRRVRRPREGESGLATASLVCGILAIVFFCIPILAWIMGALAIIFGAVAMSSPNDSSRSMAVAGLVCGAAGVVIGIVIFIIALSHPIFWWGR